MDETAATKPNRLAAIASDIKIAHSVFALPFALLATFLAANGWPGPGPVALIVVCMIAARTYAMLANRYFDREIDARNPRTAGRAIPAGRLGARDVVLGMIVTGGAMAIGAAMFGVLYDNWWPTYFTPLVLIWLGAYGLMKRWTLLCHFFLGAALGISPLAAALAINPSYLAESVLWWLAGFVMLWVGGFDIVYALQDMDVDRKEGLHSVPAKFGKTGSLIVARIVHLLALVALVMTYRTSPALDTIFFIGLCIVGLVLVVEHRAAARDRFTMAFFTANGVIAIVLGALGVADVFV